MTRHSFSSSLTKKPLFGQHGQMPQDHLVSHPQGFHNVSRQKDSKCRTTIQSPLLVSASPGHNTLALLYATHCVHKSSFVSVTSRTFHEANPREPRVSLDSIALSLSLATKQRKRHPIALPRPTASRSSNTSHLVHLLLKSIDQSGDLFVSRWKDLSAKCSIQASLTIDKLYQKRRVSHNSHTQAILRAGNIPRRGLAYRSKAVCPSFSL